MLLTRANYSYLFAVRPEIRAVSGLVRVEAGQRAELACEVTRGSPQPEVTWSRQVR